MPDAVVEACDHGLYRRRPAGVHTPMRGEYYGCAHISFAEVLTSSRQLQKPTKVKIHLAITSDRVVTATSNLDHRCIKTWGIYQ